MFVGNLIQFKTNVAWKELYSYVQLFDALEFNLCDWKFICKGFKRYSFPSEHSSLWVTNGFTLISA